MIAALMVSRVGIAGSCAEMKKTQHPVQSVYSRNYISQTGVLFGLFSLEYLFKSYLPVTQCGFFSHLYVCSRKSFRDGGRKRTFDKTPELI